MMVLRIFDRTASAGSTRWGIGIGPGELPGNQPFQSFDGVSVVIPGDREPIAFGYFSEFANVTGLAGRFEAIRSPAISRF